MQVILTGTGSPLPDPQRAGPSTLVRAGGATFLVDCGRGVLMRAAAVGVGANALTAVLLTHLHSDHVTDLSDVITTRWITTFEPSPLVVIGPPGTRALVDALLASLEADVRYRLTHHADLSWEPPVDVREVGDGTVWDADGVRITVAPTDHRPVEPSIGFRVEHDGHAVVVAGDTVPCPSLDGLAAGADVLVVTAIRKDLLAGSGIARLEDVCDYHSSVEEAAATAARAGVHTLALTHLVPAPGPDAEAEWRSPATAHFPGAVVVAADLTRIDVP